MRKVVIKFLTWLHAHELLVFCLSTVATFYSFLFVSMALFAPEHLHLVIENLAIGIGILALSVPMIYFGNKLSKLVQVWLLEAVIALENEERFMQEIKPAVQEVEKPVKSTPPAVVLKTQTKKVMLKTNITNKDNKVNAPRKGRPRKEDKKEG